MEQDNFDREMALNRRAYEELKDRIRKDYAGQYVGIAHGRLVAAGPSFHDVTAVVLQTQPTPEHFVVFPADQEPAFDVYWDTYSEYE